MNCIKSIACPKCGRNEWDGPTYCRAIYLYGRLVQDEYLNYKCKICSYQRREPTLDQKEQANKDTKDGWPILIRKNNWWCGIDVNGVFRHSDNYPVTEAARFFWDQVMEYINSIKNDDHT